MKKSQTTKPIEPKPLSIEERVKLYNQGKELLMKEYGIKEEIDVDVIPTVKNLYGLIDIPTKQFIVSCLEFKIKTKTIA